MIGSMQQRRGLRLRGFDYSIENTAYFVTCRFNQVLPQTIRAKLFDRLLLVSAELAFDLDALVVMPDHVHLIIRSPQEAGKSLSDIMCALKSKSLYLLKKEGVIATTPWSRGFYEHVLRNDADLLEKLNYLMQNPVKAKLCSESSHYKQLFVAVLEGESGATQGRPLRG